MGLIVNFSISPPPGVNILGNESLPALILVCCVALFAALIFFVKEWNSGFGPAATIFLYGNFLFTLIMIVKRSHVLFQSEYGEHTAR
ncbi:hypothetical protein G432_05315 [Sphingomonas sp. MM-1]|uniref:hypothetical protein n=1 Tax=Sphingomonas sp. MM-1 TaxID=745310 RepID=UPI0002C1597F|nr:hypothetical protein [Sphingomonas sp. MM-1]AGH48790.1 hypothetical protein G432_05315 [Sphingomonas sp. MM-1]